MKLNDKLLSFLGIAVRSGNVSFGYNCVKDGIRNKSVCLVILAQDLSEKTKKNIIYDIGQSKLINPDLEWIQINKNISDICVACGKYSGILGIRDTGISSKIKELAAVSCAERSL